jgi:hypothetical protein
MQNEAFVWQPRPRILFWHEKSGDPRKSIEKKGCNHTISSASQYFHFVAVGRLPPFLQELVSSTSLS